MNLTALLELLKFGLSMYAQYAKTAGKTDEEIAEILKEVMAEYVKNDPTTLDKV